MKGCVSVARITMQELADSLGTSRITVWKALTNRPGVSDTLRAEIQHKAQELGYYAAERTAHAQPQRTFSVVVARPELPPRSGCRSSTMPPRSWRCTAST